MFRSLTVIATLFALIGVNIIFYNFSVRFDLTEGKIYTLSDSTRKIIKELPDEILIKAFVSEKIPSQVIKTRQDLNDLLSEYQALSGGLLKVEYTDPVKKTEDENLAKYVGVPELQMQVIEKDQRQVVKAYMGLAVIKEKKGKVDEKEGPFAKIDKYESIPVIQDFSNFEYELTSAILKVSNKEDKVIGFLSGHGEHEFMPPENSYIRPESDREDYGFKELLEKNYIVNTIKVPEKTEKSTSDPKIEGIDTLIIAGPKQSFKDYEVNAIKDFVKNGKNAIFLIDQIEVERSMMANKLPEDYSSLLSEWGINVKNSLVMDRSHENAAFNQGFITFALPYPYWVKAVNLNTENSITSEMDSFILPWVSPLEISKKDDVKIDILAYTSKNYALAETRVKKMVPVNEDKLSGVEKTSINEVDEVKTSPDKDVSSEVEKTTKEDAKILNEDKKEGEKTSILKFLINEVFAEESKNPEVTSEKEKQIIPSPALSSEKDVIKTEPASSVVPPLNKEKTPEMKEVWEDQMINLDPQQQFKIERIEKEPLPLALIAQKKGEGKVMFVGDSDFITDDFSRQFSSNIIFFLNSVDAFTLGEELISIRSKFIQDRPIGDISETEKNIIKWGNIIIVPMLFVAAGLIRRSIRNARKVSLS